MYTSLVNSKSCRIEMGIAQHDLAESIDALQLAFQVLKAATPPAQKIIHALLQRLGYSDAPLMLTTDETEADITLLQF